MLGGTRMDAWAKRIDAWRNTNRCLMLGGTRIDAWAKLMLGQNELMLGQNE